VSKEQKQAEKQIRTHELFTKDTNYKWYRHLIQDGVLAGLQNDFSEREMGRLELHGRRVVLIGTDD